MGLIKRKALTTDFKQVEDSIKDICMKSQLEMGRDRHKSNNHAKPKFKTKYKGYAVKN